MDLDFRAWEKELRRKDSADSRDPEHGGNAVALLRLTWVRWLEELGSHSIVFPL